MIVPYDPRAVDFSGASGVSVDQQAWSKDLVTRTIAALPSWADVKVAQAAGYETADDGV